LALPLLTTLGGADFIKWAQDFGQGSPATIPLFIRRFDPLGVFFAAMAKMYS